MKSTLIIILILTIISTTKISISHTPDVVEIWSKSLDKEKRELVKQLKIKTEIEIKRNIYKSDSTKNSIVIYENDYDENGNQTYYKVYGDSLMIKPRYGEEYVTDEMGNVIEAYRQGKLIGTQEFDDEGRIIELVNYDEDGDSEWSYEYEYDYEGNLTLKLQYIYDELVDTIEYNSYEYILIGEKKFLKSKISLLSPSKILFESKEIYDYDSSGREILYQEYGPDRKILQEKYRDYTSQTGYRKFYGLDGILEFTDSLKLNSVGKSIVIMRYENEKLTKRIYREYDESGKLVSELDLSEEGKRLIEWKYNEVGQEIEFKRYENEVVNYIKTFDYLDNGLPTNTTTSDIKKGEKEIHEFLYEFYE